LTLTSSAEERTLEERPVPRLQAEEVTAGYGGVPVIRGVSIAVGAGEVVAIIGPNGAGKSTLLKSLVGILRLSGGRVLLGDTEVTNFPPEELAPALRGSPWSLA